ncbi:MAG TPA: polysulfide reductase NrfD [Acidobacteriota bacterium]|nr:polysulfide reductase NrfD [Acidobacteriota bacterium]HNB69535.1 polysulfide reductase NrfD [Acidobacteriota bacterium]HNC43480.1 polysulfide reductase NrfD [Acidobacteriota bacterium]HND20124.1 polysulfide reductase NrfD [Acidobacteriota bacterium]HNG91520.1 polysulfide reductase NrfD [Acidobacteriota bacterium]
MAVAELDKQYTYDEKGEIVVVEPGHNFESVTGSITDVVLTPLEKTPKGWIFGFFIAFSILQLLMVSVAWLLYRGVGIWGINVPIGWGFDIVNFVWWIGIGHAGTLISAILLLFKQQWRTSINRFAEAMTLFAVACAAMFPLLHTGRPWYAAYFLLPQHNTLALWFPQFRSPLMWDVFAVSTYGSVSFLFWYIGLVPDLASIRDRAKNQYVKILAGMFALGWRGSARHWARYETIYTILAGLSTPLVLSVHTIVSFDFAVGIIPGWHSTVFPPYFVAGAVYSGFAMVLTLMIPMRYFYKMEDFITMRHLENMAKITLVTGSIVAYAYLTEIFYAWYSGSEFEWYMMKNRIFGPYRAMYWMLILCNVITPQLLWSQRIRRNVPVLFVIAIIVNIGMWLERYVIVVVSLTRDFLPSSWGMFSGTIWDWGLYIGTMGLFLTLLFLFMRLIPMINVFEVKMLLPQAKLKESHHHD